jgi:hypothetical protein
MLMTNYKGEDKQMTTDITADESKLTHRECVAQLSDTEFEQWQKNSTEFAKEHFELLEVEIAKTIDNIQQNPHDLFNISCIGSTVQSLGEMMQEYDYLGPINMGLGHEKELDIMNKIASIAADIKDAVELYHSARYDSKRVDERMDI